mgnify:CR=1 FL=1
MVFSSLVFLCVFFPLQMLVYYLAKGIEARNTVLILFSLVFYAWGEPFFIVLLLFMCFVDWAVSQGIYKYRGTGKSKAFLVLGCVIDLGLLAFFKYTVFILTETQSWFGFPSVVPKIALPIGISFYTFQLLSYMVDVYRQEVPAQPKFRRLLLYVSLFHQCIAGPIVRYKDVSEQILCRHVDSEDMRNGINRFVSGLAKKVLLANVCGSIASRTILSGAAADQAANLPTLENASALTLWLGCFAYALQIYLDFSAYSDMAIGMGLMVGFRYKENFNYPYISKSASEFWRRWHMTLSFWFRDYVYIPLGGNRCSRGRHLINLLVVWLLTGLWHGSAWNFVLWGLYYAALLVGEKFLWGKTLQKLPGLVQHVYALVLIIVGWVLFRSGSLTQVGEMVSAMFGAAPGGLWSGESVYYLRQFAWEWAVAFIAAMPVKNWLSARLEACREAGSTAAAVTLAWGVKLLAFVLLGWSVVRILSTGVQSFLYFQF